MPSETPGGEPAPRQPGSRYAPPRWALVALQVVAAGVVVAFLVARFAPTSTTLGLPYSELKTQIAAGNVGGLTFTNTDVEGDLKSGISYGGSAKATHFKSHVPDFNNPELLTLLDQNHVNTTAKPPGDLGGLLLNLVPFALLIGVWIWMTGGARRQAAGMADFGRSHARTRLGTGASKITFADAAGVDEAKAELKEIVDYLRAPQKFQRLGGRMPRGTLLLGPPGTGKTLLARAVSGEAGVPFFSISASQFVEMFVGVGASRVRSLFEEAKKASPAVIFVDELDAVGRQRGAGLGGGNDEREQTLNQLLVEMDGFDPGIGVAILAATNRPDILDPALLRPGRFDRRIFVALPDLPGRLAILKVHTRKIPLADDVDLNVMARSTPGMSGADLASLVNEAALHGARSDQDSVTGADFEHAFDRVLLGAERKIVLTVEDRRTVAYHESGHAIVGWYLPESDPVHKITIVPHGGSLGLTQSLPEADQYNLSEGYLKAKIAMSLGGRAAERVALGSATTGAQNDLEGATSLARRMVVSWGMSPRVGPFSVDDSASAVFLGRELAGRAHLSQHTADMIDEEVTRLLNEGLATAERVLKGHRSQLDRMAAELLSTEVLDEVQIAKLLGPRAITGAASA